MVDFYMDIGNEKTKNLIYMFRSDLHYGGILFALYNHSIGDALDPFFNKDLIKIDTSTKHMVRLYIPEGVPTLHFRFIINGQEHEMPIPYEKSFPFVYYYNMFAMYYSIYSLSFTTQSLSTLYHTIINTKHEIFSRTAFSQKACRGGHSPHDGAASQRS